MSEWQLRLTIFTTTFLLCALTETLFPKRTPVASKPERWLTNISLTFLNTLTLRLIFPLGAVGIAIFTKSQNWGLLNLTNIPENPLTLILSILFLDLTIYLQHVASHKIPILWKLHKLHHADLDLDVTSGTRFHTIEILLSMLYKSTLILALGLPATSVLIFEILLNTTTMFNHANIRIPEKLDTLIRKLIVTPDMHRIHHSQDQTETDSNYGFNLPWWDYLFKTYTKTPKLPQETLPLGIKKEQT